MEFLGVKKGINFIIVGEIMGVISSIFFGFATLLLAISLTTINSGNADEQGVVFILSSVPGLISRITVMLSSIVLGIGLIKALRDESKFKEALVILIISMLIFLHNSFYRIFKWSISRLLLAWPICGLW